MIIDCHGHYTTEPSQLKEYRERQKAEVRSIRRTGRRRWT